MNALKTLGGWGVTGVGAGFVDQFAAWGWVVAWVALVGVVALISRYDSSGPVAPDVVVDVEDDEGWFPPERCAGEERPPGRWRWRRPSRQAARGPDRPGRSQDFR